MAKRVPWTMLLKNYPQSERVNSVSEGAEALYVRLLALSDDNGNYHGTDGLVASYALGHRLANRQVTFEDVESRLRELETAGLIVRYDNGRYLHIVNCYKYLRDDVTRDFRFPPEPPEIKGVINARLLSQNGTGTEPARNRQNRVTLR